MQVKYEKDSDSKYIKTGAKGSVAKTEKREDWLLVDFNKSNEIVGVEILDASDHPITIRIAGGELYCDPAIREVKSQCKPQVGHKRSPSVGGQGENEFELFLGMGSLVAANA